MDVNTSSSLITMLPSVLKLGQTGATIVSGAPPSKVDVSKLPNAHSTLANVARFEERNLAKLTPIEIGAMLARIAHIREAQTRLLRTYLTKRQVQDQVLSVMLMDA
jgi:predicted RNA-binding Zn ribbon-like protein